MNLKEIKAGFFRRIYLKERNCELNSQLRNADKTIYLNKLTPGTKRIQSEYWRNTNNISEQIDGAQTQKCV